MASTERATTTAAATSRGLLLPSNGSSATGNPRNKCALQPGHSLMDWIRLGNSGADLSGTAGRVVPVGLPELIKHNKRHDAWLAIHGRVYNVTRYMDFHPGGVEELMRGVGRDATKLFDDTHAWVNYAQLLAKCYIGPLKKSVVLSSTALQDLKPPSATLPAATPAANNRRTPRYDWTQKQSEIAIYIYTHKHANPGFVLKRNPSNAKEAASYALHVYVDACWHVFRFEFEQPLIWPTKEVKINPETGKIELIWQKQTTQLWRNIGSCAQQRLTALDVTCLLTTTARVALNHDSYFASFKFVDENISACLPLGCHIVLKLDAITARNYTPIPAKYAKSASVTRTTRELHFIIKRYAHGVLSNALHSLPLTQELSTDLVPRCKLSYAALATHCNVLFLAAGSGLTAFLGLIEALLMRGTPKIEQLHLLYFNKTPTDIWLEADLTQLAATDARFKLRNVLSDAGEQQEPTWQGETGRISEPLIASLLTKAVSFVAVCGPTGFNQATAAILKKLNFNEQFICLLQ